MRVFCKEFLRKIYGCKYNTYGEGLRNLNRSILLQRSISVLNGKVV